MIDSGIPQGHHYVDISKPVDMLVLSRNEYPLNLLPPEAVYPARQICILRDSSHPPYGLLSRPPVVCHCRKT
jgi:hypothetical protein